MPPGVYSQSDEFKKFKNCFAQRKVIVDHESAQRIWRYYDYGSKECIPLIFLHGATGTAEIFYKQMLGLCPKGYRIISVQYPLYSSHEHWVKAFDKFVDALRVPKVHLFGAALGGYLAQLYINYRPMRVLSLLLCNSFCDTQYFADTTPLNGMFSWTPEFVLKRLLFQNISENPTEPEIANSIEFINEQVEQIPQEELASRLNLNCTIGPVVAPAMKIDQTKITIIDCVDDTFLPDRVRDEVYKLLPEARQAFLKTGGHFPYLSRADQLNLYIEVHLRHCNYVKCEDTNLVQLLSQ